ncbi:MAG: hypothetical protein H6577_09990 [Lewinellaceae bacterium]|nr:hypothetical protein [Saprospiraceae bacterium]MCB9338447.1 hypothetical protein [Lewinellaceae bacterium]
MKGFEMAARKPSEPEPQQYDCTDTCARREREKEVTRAVLSSSLSDEHYTPPLFVNLARRVMGGIDLDPASNEMAQGWIGAKRYHTVKADGLFQSWEGRLWLNPPYGRQTAHWTGKAIREFEKGKVAQAVILVRPAVGSSWFVELSKRYVRCEPFKRIRFIDANGNVQPSPPHGNAFFYLGNDIEKFREVFIAIGVVLKPL